MVKFFKALRKSILLAAVLGASLTAFAKDKSNKLKVGFLTDMPYLMSMNPDSGCMEGYGYDYLQMISNFTGWEYEYVHGEWYVLWDKFQKGEIDILEDISYVPEREGKMLFPNVPMGREIYRLYVYDTNSSIQAEKLEETLTGKKIGVTAGTIQHQILCDWVKKRHIRCLIIPYNSDFERNEELAAGKLDAVVELEASSINTWEPVIEIGSTDYYLALSKGNEKHLEELNKALNSIESIIPDFNNSLFYNYYSRTIVSKRLSDTEKEWAENHKVLRCGYFDDLISNSQDDPGAYEEIMEEFKKSVGLNDLELKFIYYKDTDDLIADLQHGKIDVAYPMCAYPGNAEYENLSIVSSVGTLMISSITKKNFSSPNEVKSVGIPRNGDGYFHAKRAFPKAEIIKYDSPMEILSAVSSGEIDVGSLPDRLIRRTIRNRREFANLKVVQLTTPFETGIVVKRGETALFQLIRRGISLMDPKFIKDAVAKNTVIQIDYSYGTFIANHFVSAIFFLMVFVGILCAMTISIYRRRIFQKNYMTEKSLRNQLSNALKQAEEHQKKERELLYLSETDKLTGISNRGAEGKIKDFISVGTQGMFALFDIDKFKAINDNYGHPTGDKVLIAIANTMKFVFRESDIILRLGGDEFAVFAIGINRDNATILINRFITEIKKIRIPEMENKEISISLGATFIENESDVDFESVYRRADKGCYISKAEKGNSFTLC